VTDWTPGVETYTLKEAAELTGLSYEALRSRVDRGQIRALAPGRGRTRRIPRSELESSGLSVEPRPAPTADIVSELIAKLEEQAGDLIKLRQLEVRAGSLLDKAAEEQAARERAEGELDELRSWSEEVRSAGWLQRRRLLRTS
jgi:excisionase family DNA binding protein